MLLSIDMRGEGSPASRDLCRTDAHPDHWYPVACSRELKPGRMLARRFAGEPIVVARSADGTAFALEDRCGA